MSKYKVDVNAYGMEPIECDMIMDALDDNRILHIYKHDDGLNFCINEGCDKYYGGILTPEQLVALGQELIDIATGKITKNFDSGC